MRYTLTLALVLAAALPVQAGLIYTFSYTASRGTVQSFSFSMFSPTFIGPGTPPLSPFTITDRSTILPVTQALVGISTGIVLGSTFLPAGDGCFAFGSPDTELAQFHGCGAAMPNNGVSQAELVVDLSGGLPSSTGTFSNLIFDGIVILQPSLTEDPFYNCCNAGATGTLQLTIVQIPEPRSFGLLVLGICLIGTVLLAKHYSGG